MSSAEVVAAGLHRSRITAAVKSGQLVRLRRSVLVDGELWRASPPWDRHTLGTRAFARSMTPEEAAAHAFSHHSALALHGIASYGVDERVHLLRTDGTRTRNGGLMAGHQPVDPEWATTAQGVRVVSPALAVVQVAAAFGTESGLVSADSALFTGATTPTDLHEALGMSGVGRRPGAARLAVALADALRESPGESRAWWLFRCGGLPEPELQVELHAADGTFLGRPDFLWREARVIGEFDGALKYESPAALQAEKWRQDRFGDEGYEVFRLGWPDLDRPRTALDRARAAFARAAARRDGSLRATTR